jgi:hypothetical protein
MHLVIGGRLGVPTFGASADQLIEVGWSTGQRAVSEAVRTWDTPWAAALLP